jgi:hypothetical protein
MTVDELLKVLRDAASKGYGNLPVLFDTEAQCYDVHMVPVDSADREPDAPTPCVVLSERAPHRSGHHE